MKRTTKKIRISLAAVMALCFGFLGFSNKAFAEGGTGFSVSPMYFTMILNPGETVKDTITISSPNTATSDTHYKVSIHSFGVTEQSDYSIDYDTVTGYNDIMNWITLEKDEGYVSPNETVNIPFSITVPKNAPAGGQYASIQITSLDDRNTNGEGVMIKEQTAIASFIYASVAGETIQSGEIAENNIPGFLLTTPLSATSIVKNTGNVHQTAKYTMQVFPLFSDEEVYTNEENPSSAIIIPEQTYLATSTWKDVPSAGIFKVRQTVEFAGQTSVSEKFVIICPIWLLAIIIFVLLLIIFWIIAKARSKKKK